MIDTIVNNFDIWTDAQGIKSRTRVKGVENISLEGIASLRELILELAILGKLVPQDPKDEPASFLLNKIKKERENKNIVKKEKKEGQAYSGKIFNIKIQGWELCKLEDIGDTNIGLTYSPNEVSDTGTIVLRSSNIQNGEIELSDIVRVNKFIKENVLVKQGDLLICARNGSKKLVGKCALIRKLPEPMAFGAFMALYRSPFNEYLRIFIESPIYRRNLEGVATTTINQITQDNLKNTYIPLPPLAEQKRIVIKVDELMALCDKLENEQFNNLKTHQVLVKTLLETLTQAKDADELQIAWNRLSVHFDELFCTDDSIDQLKQTILQLAVMGKLVKQDQNDERASELLKKIEKEKDKLVIDKKLKKQKPLPKIAEENKPFVIPSSWLWVPWGSVLAYDDYPFKRGPFGSSLKKDMFIESGYKVYEQYCPINDDCSFERYYISDELYKNLEGFAVKAGDYLVSCSGATLGRITQVPDDFKEGIINQALLRVRMNHKYIDKDFFKLLFRSPYFQKMIFDNSTGSAIPNVKGVNELKIMPVPFLPIEEQRKIVKKIEELYNICDRLKEKILQSQKIKGVLSKTIVEKAVQ
ncbi:MAG: restriction endonuclease subunit S [Bacteroidetes bacterium]|nr:restriction endonuclease subunit S [Bacteroidota bacterium]